MVQWVGTAWRHGPVLRRRAERNECRPASQQAVPNCSPEFWIAFLNRSHAPECLTSLRGQPQPLPLGCLAIAVVALISVICNSLLHSNKANLSGKLCSLPSTAVGTIWDLKLGVLRKNYISRLENQNSRMQFSIHCWSAERAVTVTCGEFTDWSEGRSTAPLWASRPSKTKSEN